MIDASHVAEFLKVILAPRYLFGIWIVGALILFMPEDALTRLGISEFINTYRGWVGITTLLTAGLWVSIVGTQLYDRLGRWREERSQNKQFNDVLISRFNSLSESERFYLLMCLDRRSQTFIGYIFNGHVASLINKGLLRPGNNSDPWNCPLTIPDEVWDFLIANIDTIMPKERTDLHSLIKTYENLRDYQRKNFLRP